MAADGSFQIDHDYVMAGSYQVVVEVTDDDGGSGTAILPVEVRSDFDSALRFQWWQNIASPLDVNSDGQVTPLDALLVINSLNKRGSFRFSELPYALAPANPPYLDVNGDFNASPLDALLVINFLNQLGGEGEKSSSHEKDYDSLDWLALDHLRRSRRFRAAH